MGTPCGASNHLDAAFNAQKIACYACVAQSDMQPGCAGLAAWGGFTPRRKLQCRATMRSLPSFPNTAAKRRQRQPAPRPQAPPTKTRIAITPAPHPSKGLRAALLPCCIF